MTLVFLDLFSMVCLFSTCRPGDIALSKIFCLIYLKCMKGKKPIPFENGIRYEMGEQRSQANEFYYLKILISEVEASSPKIPECPV